MYQAQINIGEKREPVLANTKTINDFLFFFYERKIFNLQKEKTTEISKKKSNACYLHRGLTFVKFWVSFIRKF